MRKAAMMLCYNQLELTKQALASLVVQDIGELEIFICNNGSSDGTREWLEDFKRFVADTHLVHLIHHQHNVSPNIVVNMMYQHVFALGHPYVLGMANDVVLPANAYSQLLRWPRGMVTASECAQLPPPEMREDEIVAVNECTPMSVALVRRWFYEALVAQGGQMFDEGYYCYASDCDLALRMGACGLRGVQLNLQFWHYGSATWKKAPEMEKKGMLRQADEDRGYFVRKWGFTVDSPEYGKLAGDPNFRGESLLQSSSLARAAAAAETLK